MAHDDAGTSLAGEGRRSALPASSLPGWVGAGTGSTAGAGAAGDTPRAAAAPHRVLAVLGACGAGTVAAVFGTLLHGHLLGLGGIPLPAGAVAALVLAGSLFLLCGLWARNVIMTAVAGAVAYGVVALLSTSSKTLILTGSSEAAPATALAGNLWLFGVLVVTLAAVVGCAVVLRPSRRS
ncbi:hypothetical protein GM708_12285 [Vibrio cholerae]|nr:hypothetical protein [Vibrio cholerae]